MARKIKTAKEVEYDTKNAQKINDLLKKSIRGLTITDIASELRLNRHTVTKILDILLMEKKVDSFGHIFRNNNSFSNFVYLYTEKNRWEEGGSR